MRSFGETKMNFLDADYSAIEARIVNWLAGQEDALERFRKYDAAPTEEEKYRLDPYRIQASLIYGIPVAQVDKFPQRFVGKNCELGCGFGLGPPKFRVNCKEKGGYDLPIGLEYKAVKTWRATHKKTVQFWYDLEEAAKRAIVKKNTIFPVGQHLSFLSRDIERMHFLLMRLPSGRKLAYPKPKIANDRISFFGQIPMTKNWSENISIWGGTLANNSTQAVAADIMANGAHQAEQNGYAICTLIHDEALVFHKKGQTVNELIQHMTNLPSWAAGLPIASEGEEIPFYKKS